MKKEMCEIVHNDYNKITSCMMWLGPRLRLNINARLWSSSNDKSYNYHTEVMYLSGKVPLINMNLTPHIYYSIDPVDSSLKNDLSVRINTIDMPTIQRMANKILEIADMVFTNRNSNNIDDIYNKIKNMHCSVGLYTGNFTIEIEPTMNVIGIARDKSIGFNIMLNGIDEPFFIDMNTAINMASIFNQNASYMIMMGQILLLNLQAPYGTNLIDFTNR
jgi:hypothetical protein